MVSHEYRTPLTVILSSSFLIERLGRKNEYDKVDNHLEKIRASVKQMTNLLEDVIAVGKSEEGLLTPKPQYFDLSVLMNTLIDEIYSIDSRMHAIDLNFNADNTIIYSDPKLLRQVINNLLTNACKYSKIGTNVYILVSIKNDSFNIDVKDEGIGISDDDLQSLFTPFFRNKEHIGAIPGSGLGLTIVKRSVELLGGKLSVISKVNEGSTFSVTFPLKVIYPDFYKDMDKNA
jgi:signal transduction histidine kinase